MMPYHGIISGKLIVGIGYIAEMRRLSKANDHRAVLLLKRAETRITGKK